MQEFSRTNNSMSDQIEVKQFVAILWRRKWLLVLVTLLAVTSGFVISNLMTPVFEASTTLLIDQAPGLQSSEYSAIIASERLARTYAQLLTKRPVTEETLTRLELDTDLEKTVNGTSVQIIEDTQLIELKVQNSNPVLAARIANTIVEVFNEQNEALQAGRFAASKASLRAQLDRVGEQIQANEAAIANLGTPRTSLRIAELERLQTELAQYQGSYTNLLQSYEQVRTEEARTISNIIQVELAEPPSEPIRPRILLNTLLAGVVGGMIALGVVFLIEHLDDTIRATEGVERIFQVSILGYIPEMDELSEKVQASALLAGNQNSAVGEAFRSLRTNTEFLGNPGLPSTILVASPGGDEGKTTIASHLAATIGSGEKKVVLIDADFRRPGIHEIFGVPNELGLSDILINDIEPQAVATSFGSSRLKLITSGSRFGNPAELFGSTRLLEVLAELREQFDTVIFDGPPFLVTEAFVLASRLKSVLLVIQLGRTREAVARTIIKQLERGQANLLGVVLNKAPKNQAYASGEYVYYHSDNDRTNFKWPKQQGRLSSLNSEDTHTSPYSNNQPSVRRRAPILGPYKERIDQLWKETEQQPPKKRYTARRIYELIQEEGYQGSETTVRHYVSRRRRAMHRRED